MGPRAIVIGNGLVGHSLARQLRKQGTEVVLCSKRKAKGTHELRLGTAADDVNLARIVSDPDHDVIVLAHGPTDPGWCDLHEREAHEVHVGAAHAALLTGARILLVSSDSVFPGDEDDYGDDVLPSPKSAYGRVKYAAEEVVRAARLSCVVRVSSMYGWSRHGRVNFAQDCLLTLHQGRRFPAPEDQYFRPVYLGDAMRLLSRAVHDQLSGVLHLGGPERLSRYSFALLIAETLRLSPSLVKGVPRSQTRWASRPSISSLRTTDFQMRFGFELQLTDPRRGVIATVQEWRSNEAVRS